MGGVAIGIQPFYSTIAGKKPVITGVAVTPVDSVQKNATILFGDVTKVLGPFGTYAKDVLHAKTAALVYPNIAGITRRRGGHRQGPDGGRREGEEGGLLAGSDRPDRAAHRRRARRARTW